MRPGTDAASLSALPLLAPQTDAPPNALPLLAPPAASRYSPSELRDIRRNFRDTSGLRCPHHADHALDVLWVRKVTLDDGIRVPTTIEVACAACNAPEVVDLLVPE